MIIASVKDVGQGLPWGIRSGTNSLQHSWRVSCKVKLIVTILLRNFDFVYLPKKNAHQKINSKQTTYIHAVESYSVLKWSKLQIPQRDESQNHITWKSQLKKIMYYDFIYRKLYNMQWASLVSHMVKNPPAIRRPRFNPCVRKIL